MADRNPYADMLYFPHPDSPRHLRMSRQDRAAQFSPFAALTGHEEALQETGRLTARRTEPGWDARKRLNRKLWELREHPEIRETVTVRYFVPDERKAGGAYADHTGYVKKVDDVEKMLIFEDGLRVPMEEIQTLESRQFQQRDLTE